MVEVRYLARQTISGTAKSILPDTDYFELANSLIPMASLQRNEPDPTDPGRPAREYVPFPTTSCHVIYEDLSWNGWLTVYSSYSSSSGDGSGGGSGGETTCSIDVEVVAMIARASPTPTSETWTWTDLPMAPSKMVFSAFAHLAFVLENGGPIHPCLFNRAATLIKRTWPGKRLGRFEELAEDAVVIEEREDTDKGQFLPELRKDALQKFRSHEDRKERQDVEGEERGTYVPMFQEGEFRLILDGMRQYDEMYFAALSAREGHRDVEEAVG